MNLQFRIVRTLRRLVRKVRTNRAVCFTEWVHRELCGEGTDSSLIHHFGSKIQPKYRALLGEMCNNLWNADLGRRGSVSNLDFR